MSNRLTWVLIGVATLAPWARGAEPVIHSVWPTTATTVGLYEKFEARVDLDATYSNPFDADELDLWAEFTSPSGKTWKIWGFYNPSHWAYLWMVRFAPTEKGMWKYVVKVKDKEGTAQSRSASFTAVDSPHHGFIRIGPNPRYLMHDDGASFYGVGLWYNDEYERFNQGAITEQNLDELKRFGVNFISFFPTPLETMGSGLGRYDENRCGRLDQLFEWCEKRDIYVSWNIWFHSYISQAVWGGGNARYRNNPYKLVANAVDFFTDPLAWRYQEKLYRYMMARWGYSRALFLWFVVDEINGTEGWEQGDKTAAERWCAKVDQFFNTHDPYGRPTTGTQSGGISQWWPSGYRIFDIAAREIYEAQGHPMPKSGKVDVNEDSPLRYSYRIYAEQTRNLWKQFSKPAIIGECGWDHTYYEPGTPGYLAMYHNALWASLANGLCCTPFWWAHSDYINGSVITNQMRFFAGFVNDIDFAHLEFEPAQIDAGKCDGWAMKSNKLIFGWIVNPRTSVANESFTIAGLPDGSYTVRLYRTWRGRYLEAQTIPCRDAKITVTIPELRTAGGRASHIGDDVAFKIALK
jgi:hypothetical protein